MHGVWVKNINNTNQNCIQQSLAHIKESKFHRNCIEQEMTSLDAMITVLYIYKFSRVQNFVNLACWAYYQVLIFVNFQRRDSAE